MALMLLQSSVTCCSGILCGDLGLFFRAVQNRRIDHCNDSLIVPLWSVGNDGSPEAPCKIVLQMDKAELLSPELWYCLHVPA